MARRIIGGITVAGLEETIAAASAAEKDAKQAMFREIRRELRPMVSDIKDRFRELGGTGPRVATTVRSSVTAKGAAVRMGAAKHPYSLGREFGAKRGQTRPFIKRVQSGRMSARQVGGGSRRVMIARIPYSKDSIFGPWTGNQFDLGESGGRVSVLQSSGRAFHPAIGVGAQNVFERLSKVAEKYADSFPTPSGAPSGVSAGSSAVDRLESFLRAGGIEV